MLKGMFSVPCVLLQYRALLPWLEYRCKCEGESLLEADARPRGKKLNPLPPTSPSLREHSLLLPSFLFFFASSAFSFRPKRSPPFPSKLDASSREVFRDITALLVLPPQLAPPPLLRFPCVFPCLEKTVELDPAPLLDRHRMVNSLSSSAFSMRCMSEGEGELHVFVELPSRPEMLPRL